MWGLSLNLDVPAGVVVPEVYREVRGEYIGNVMHQLGCIPEGEEGV